MKKLFKTIFILQQMNPQWDCIVSENTYFQLILMVLFLYVSCFLTSIFHFFLLLDDYLLIIGREIFVPKRYLCENVCMKFR